MIAVRLWRSTVPHDYCVFVPSVPGAATVLLVIVVVVVAGLVEPAVVLAVY